jgi:cleavage and polyadenylation specificity factor subunit 1
LKTCLSSFTDFSLEQIIPAADETTGVELEIIGASFCDPYVSLIRSDSSIAVYESTSDELEELERGDGILAAQWLSASVYKPPNTNEGLLFALTAEGALRVSFII